MKKVLLAVVALALAFSLGFATTTTTYAADDVGAIWVGSINQE